MGIKTRNDIVISYIRGKKMKNFLKRTAVKTFIQVLLTILISISIALLGDWNQNQEGFVFKFVFLVISGLLYLTSSVAYAVNDTNERRVMSELNNQNKLLTADLVNILHICKENSASVSDVINIANKENVFDSRIWSFDKSCGEICLLIYKYINQIKNIWDFDVAYIKLIEDKEKIVYMNAYANRNSTRPTIYRKQRSFNGTNTEKMFFDLKLFIRNSADIVVLVGDEVKNSFYYSGTIANIDHKNKQYIAIPVFCKDTKMIGLLEVTCHEENGLGSTKEEVKEFANKFLVVYAHMILLLHKMEKAITAGVGEPNSGKSQDKEGEKNE